MHPSSDPGDSDARFAVRVEAPARLHLGFIDVSGTLGRRFGSLGLALEDFAAIIELRRAAEFVARGPQAQRAGDYLRLLLDDHDPPCSAAVEMVQAIPQHAGLGSGTQLALAVGTAFSALFGIDYTVTALATRLDRGARSGIGIGAFEQGGFVVDAGRSATGAPAPVVARMPFPAAWRALLILDSKQRGLSGEAERAAFRLLPAFPQQAAAHIAHLTLMRLLPALAEQDCASFGAAIGEIQRSAGDYFARAQGGRFASAAVSEVLAWLEARGIAGIGQTSWGPTGFAIVDSEVRAHALLVEARSRFAHLDGIDLVVVRGCNTGHRMQILSRAQALAAQRHSGGAAQRVHDRGR